LGNLAGNYQVMVEGFGTFGCGSYKDRERGKNVKGAAQRCASSVS
jgi:hypothetical protein